MEENLNDNQVPQQQEAPETEGSSLGPTVGIIIIVVIIVLGGLYFWGRQLTQNGVSIDEIEDTSDAQVEELLNVSDSDELENIEADLGNTNLDDIDAGLDDSELEL